ncbi:histone-lysine N-methyltransferase PRDM9-like [Uloborus diversus]|uniref:histone-lysine N-methyltransferase PRDM9-like n=1 Tax=Uloborus diversus TaxID=327109 RepID=UPI002409070D|nr:histone-lysine N-methyltransferase PRDM9-like [Uloborus diversus]
MSGCLLQSQEETKPEKSSKASQRTPFTPETEQFLLAVLSGARLEFDKLDAFCEGNGIPVDDFPKEIPEEAAQPRYPKRNIPTTSYKEEDIPSEDEFLYCDLCGDEYEGHCPVHGPMLLVCNQKVPKGVPGRAKEAPPFLSVGYSGIRKAGLGIWSEKSLPQGTVFGPYKGDITRERWKTKRSGYAWKTRKNARTNHFIEGADEKSSNWLRFVNCTNVEEKQNLVAFQFRKDIYYRTNKAVLEFTELCVWYGDACGREFGAQIERKVSLSQEIRPREQPAGVECDLCHSLFSSSAMMEKHRKKHPHIGKDRRHCCPQCEYSTDVATNMKHHLAAHDGVKPHECPVCFRAFTLKHNLVRHVLTHIGIRPFRCGACGKGFTHKGNLRSHERIHSGEQPFLCPECGMRFRFQNNLTDHLRTHTGQKPYSCSHCPYRSAQSSDLRCHVIAHHSKAYPHVCEECGKGFVRPSHMIKHKTKAHTNN